MHLNCSHVSVHGIEPQTNDESRKKFTNTIEIKTFYVISYNIITAVVLPHQTNNTRSAYHGIFGKS